VNVVELDAEYAINEEVNNFSLILFCSVDDDAFNSAADTKFKSTEELNSSNASIDADSDAEKSLKVASSTKLSIILVLNVRSNVGVINPLLLFGNEALFSFANCVFVN
jgi:hypothetical protein